MQLKNALIATAATLASAQNSSTTCNDYVLIDIRGTGEAQGPSVGFTQMVNMTLAGVSGGITYYPIYPAFFNQTFLIGSQHTVEYINNGTQNCPDQKYAILGYSQGASVTMGALMNLTDTSSAAYKAIEAVLVIGNPYHIPNELANVDQFGGKNTTIYKGSQLNITNYPGYPSSGIPQVYYDSGKLLDICFTGDIICAPAYPNSSLANHLGYIGNADVQDMGAKFLVGRLNGSNTTTANGSSSTTSSGGSSASSTASSTGSATGSSTGSSSTASPSTVTGAAAAKGVSNALFAVVLGLAAAVML